MDIRTVYEMVSNSGQGSPRQYIGGSKNSKQLQTKHKRRKTFVEEIQKLGKWVPGPGKYEANPEEKKGSQKMKKKLDFAEEAKKPSGRYYDKYLKDKQKVPPVGKYELEVDHTEELRSRYKIIGDKTRKEAPLFKPTQFDENQPDCIKIGPGFYNPNKAFGDEIKSFRAPQGDHLKKVDEEDGSGKGKEKIKRSQSLPKLPGSQSYRPIPQSYETFDHRASVKSTYQSVGTFTKSSRRLSVQEGPGPKYNLISQWSPKNNSKQRNLFKSVSSVRSPGIYH